MHLHLSQIQIREASSEDNLALIELTQQSPMQGIISLRIDRNPDFFGLLGLRGANTVFVATQNDQIIGSFSDSIKKVWLNGKESTVHYLADLKILPAFRGGSAAVKLVKAMNAYLNDQEGDICYCTISKGNDKVLPLFQGRLGIPAFESLGEFSVYQILPTARKQKKHPNYTFSDTISDQISLPSFYNAIFQAYQLAPLIEAESLLKTSSLIALHKGEIIAAISLADVHPFKQYVVIDMSLGLKILVGISKILNRLFGLMRLPSIGEPIQTLHVRYFGCKKGHAVALQQLLQQARNIARAQGFHFLSIGIHHKDGHTNLCKGMPKITFTSQALITSLQSNPEMLKRIQAGTVFEDFSLS